MNSAVSPAFEPAPSGALAPPRSRTRAPAPASRAPAPSGARAAVPVQVRQHASYKAARGGTAVTMLTVYIVLLFVVPSNLQFTAFGSLGKPAALWGLGLLVWWVLSNLQPARGADALRGRVQRGFLIAFCVVLLISYTAAVLRGQPADQIGSATSSLVRVASWTGVCLVAADGVRTRDDMVALLRRISIAGGVLAALGVLQVATGESFVGWMQSIPGWNVEWGEMDSRGGLARAAGTSTHPLEYSSTMVALLPIALAHAALVMQAGWRRAWYWAVPPALLMGVLAITVTRSATIGLLLTLAIVLPFLPRGFRGWVLTAIVVGGITVLISFPGVVTTIVNSFVGVAEDSSAISRANALARVPEFASASPIIGAGWGTFLPRYYIFDNAWVLMLIEAGVVGVAAFALMVLAALFGAAGVAVKARSLDGRLLGTALVAVTATCIVQLALFDGLSFPQYSGVLFLVFGMCMALPRVSASIEADRGFAAATAAR